MNPGICSCQNEECFGSIIKDSVITCDESIYAAESVSKNEQTNIMSTLSTIVTSTQSINFHNKKVRYKVDCDILHTVL